MSSFKIERENFRMPCRGAGGEKIVYITTPFWVRGLLPTIYNLILRCFIIISMLTRGEMIRSAWKTFFDPHEFARNLNSLTVLRSALRIPPKTKKLHLPNGQVKITIHKPDYKIQPRATGHNIFFARWIDTEPWKIQMPWRWSQSILYYNHCATQSTTTYLVIKTWWNCNATAVIYKI